MTAFNAFPYSGLASQPFTLPLAQHGYDARLKVYMAYITLASQTTSDTINLFELKKGIVPLFGFHLTDTSLGSSTVAYGITGTTGKYRAAATFTATGVPTFFQANIVNPPVPLANDEVVFVTIGAATMPASGTLQVGMVCATL